LSTNSVLPSAYQKSSDFFESDHHLQTILQYLLNEQANVWLTPRLKKLGYQAANEMDELSMTADKQGPELKKRNFWGENVNEIEFHPAYKKLAKIAVDSGMFKLKWESGLKELFRGQRNAMTFALGHLYTLGENGIYCPLCMTDGVAKIIDRHGNDEMKETLLPKIAADDVKDFYTGAMYLTEKSGGSDVGANVTKARPIGELRYQLNGEKWFCSNANAELILALARTPDAKPGTRGLSIFLIEKHLENGRKNPINIIRLKDKLGVRSMASAECKLENTLATRIGDEGNGFKIMTEMINLSRIYNAVSAMGIARRTITEAWQYAHQRTTFGRTLISHALVRQSYATLGSRWLGLYSLMWRAIEAMDKEEQGDEKEAMLLRFLTPMVKWTTAEFTVFATRESMELMGGIGYIEDGIFPKFHRDALVLPIWEGSGNIMVLDQLRVLQKHGEKLIPLLISEFKDEEIPELCEQLSKLNMTDSPDEAELKGKQFLTNLALAIQRSLLTEKPWNNIAGKTALTIFEDPFHPISKENLDVLIGWDF
jgi:alkylation response protein AidB-like acyl-CoA dehydrogenase